MNRRMLPPIRFVPSALLFLALALLAGCDRPWSAQPTADYAIYAEFARDTNVLMKNGLNRRIFNVTEAQQGSAIRREKEGAISLEPGTYRISGFSIVTMQTGFSPPVSTHGLNYPGYGVVYPAEFESDNPLAHQLGVGSPATSVEMIPSLFDLVFTCEKPTKICVGHQAGEELNGEVYLSVYDVAGTVSPYHVFARVMIIKQ